MTDLTPKMRNESFRHLVLKHFQDFGEQNQAILNKHLTTDNLYSSYFEMFLKLKRYNTNLKHI